MSAIRTGVRCLKDLRPAGPRTATAHMGALVYRPRNAPSSMAPTRPIMTTAARRDTAPVTTWSAVRPPAFGEEAEMMDDEGKSLTKVEREVESARYRAVPASPSYFSRTPVFNDSYVVVQDLARKYGRLPILPKDKVAPTAWKNKEQYRLAMGEHVKGRDFAECMKLAKRLNQIHPDLMPDDVKAGLQPFKRESNYHLNVTKVRPIDRFGRAQGVGRRKSSMARAFVVEGTGEVLINGKPLTEAFGRVHDRESAVWGLKMTDRLDKYNVWAVAEGGGTTGQAEALALAVDGALIVHEPALENPLRRGELSPPPPPPPPPPAAGGLAREQTGGQTCRGRDSDMPWQPDASRAIPDGWRGRSMATSRHARCLPGSSDKRPPSSDRRPAEIPRSSWPGNLAKGASIIHTSAGWLGGGHACGCPVHRGHGRQPRPAPGSAGHLYQLVALCSILYLTMCRQTEPSRGGWGPGRAWRPAA